MEENRQKLRILVAPLDWGLGHATRCIPLIREMVAQGYEVIIAAEGPQEVLLRQEFPGLLLLPLDGYRVKYTKTGKGLPLKMLLQWPRLKRVINQENEWLKKIAAEQQLDAIISDNRYGLYHKTVPSVFITHQLLIKSPLGKWTEKILQRINYTYINRFSHCWVPDEAGIRNLSGELGHPQKMPAAPVEYIGNLSRFVKKDVEEKKNHLLIILSGPEPQRTLLEEKIIASITHYNGTADIIRGLPGHVNQIPSTGMIQFYNHLPAEELNTKIQQAEYIISRSGYSTIMDIAALQKKSILIPTPGQTEQEYLAAYLEEKNLAVTVKQYGFELEAALLKAAGFAYQNFPEESSNFLSERIKGFINTLNEN
jgi:uncharacterized protein (TIGR00661 family)